MLLWAICSTLSLGKVHAKGMAALPRLFPDMYSSCILFTPSLCWNSGMFSRRFIVTFRCRSLQQTKNTINVLLYNIEPKICLKKILSNLCIFTLFQYISLTSFFNRLYWIFRHYSSKLSTIPGNLLYMHDYKSRPSFTFYFLQIKCINIYKYRDFNYFPDFIREIDGV